MERQYLWQHAGWPLLHADAGQLSKRLAHLAFRQGELAGALRIAGIADRRSLEHAALTQTAVATSELAGEQIDITDARNALARRLDVPNAATLESSRAADAIVGITVDALQNVLLPLTKLRLVRWNRELLPDAPRSTAPAAWRTADDAARLAEAPPAARIDDEMNAFLEWFGQPSPLPPIVHAALAHIRFLAIARDSASVAPYVSIARQMSEDRAAYDGAIERALRGDVDVTTWVAWFCDCYARALSRTLRSIDGVLRASAFWRAHVGAELNARQRIVLERYLAGDFGSWINSRKYGAIAQTSIDSAQRDLADLLEKGIVFANDGKARRTSYRLSDEFDPAAPPST
jgi:Fic family protein